MSRTMGIDYGDTRIGISLTDPLKMIASGFVTLQNTRQVFQEIINICVDKDVDSIVVGIPFNQFSEIGDAAKKVLFFAKKLKEQFTESKREIKMYEQDERYTTHDALKALHQIKAKKRKKRKIIDQVAAAKILSDFLNKPTHIELNIEKYLSNFIDK
jgi:putative holliday junction resolvase